MKTVDFSETIEACDLKVGRYRQLIEIMKVCEYLRSMSFLYHFFQVLYVLCFTTPRYQVSVYRTIGPLVYHILCQKIIPANNIYIISVMILSLQINSIDQSQTAPTQSDLGLGCLQFP